MRARRADVLAGHERRAEHVARLTLVRSGRTTCLRGVGVGRALLDQGLRSPGTPVGARGGRAGDRRGREPGSGGRGSRRRRAEPSPTASAANRATIGDGVDRAARRRRGRSSTRPATVVPEICEPPVVDVAPVARRGRPSVVVAPLTVVVVAPGFVVVVAAVAEREDHGLAVLASAPRGTAARPSRRRGSRPWPRSFTPGQVHDDRVALALHVGLGDAEAVDAVADDVDRGVERAEVGALHREQHDRDAALEVETEHGPAARTASVADERADDRDDGDDQQYDVAAHGSAGLRGLAVTRRELLVGLGQRPGRSRRGRRGSPCRARSRDRRRRRRGARPGRRSRSWSGRRRPAWSWLWRARTIAIRRCCGRHSSR